ncbi:hypothetical protein HHK36_006857 [Tetracentron sinense]|uniref:Uncharacterized protein n=1 Tax=Tetracentron sinense TaxID=13715 RepID=A0A834ZSG9_TETSI|nr:hypothetical protein HHK36_006857 [Tetracentron sinense]
MILNSLPYLNSLSSLHISGFEGFLGALHTQRPAASSSSSSSTQTSMGFLSPTLDRLHFYRCRNLEAISFQHEWVSTTLKYLCIFACPIKHLPTGLQNLLSLETLEILHCDLLESLPEDGLPTTLRRLNIWCCELLGRRWIEGGEDWPKISHIPKIESNPEWLELWLHWQEVLETLIEVWPLFTALGLKLRTLTTSSFFCFPCPSKLDVH